MATDDIQKPRLISPSELDDVLERARVEGWQELTLFGPAGVMRSPVEARGAHEFYLREPIGPRISKLAALTGLTALSVRFNDIGDAGARMLAGLTGLTSLALGANEIGPEGVRALAGLTGLTSLALGANQIGDEGARALAVLTGLTSLVLGGCGIGAEGARALAALSGLTDLNLWNNSIGSEGAHELAVLTELTSLDLCMNLIGNEGAHALVALTRLTFLQLWENQIGDAGARALAGLTRLTFLQLWENQIGDEGARSLAGLTRLTTLNLWSNRVGDAGARALAGLTRLTSLDLSHNDLGDDGARALTALGGLSYLSLYDNQISADGARALLDAWCDGPSSTTPRTLDLCNNGDMESLVPAEVLETRSAQAILAAYRGYREAEQRGAFRPLNEAKLVVVGNEAVGKTSIIRYLIHGKPRDQDEKWTSGAVIHEKIEVSAWSVQSRVRLNVWDFGGQEIMRGTHRFFMTARSLYLLVLEDRREDDRAIYEWLEMIGQRGGDSPVIVVINKSDGEVQQRQLNETGLRREYPAIAGFARTSCNDDAAAASSIARLRELIVGVLDESPRLKHVRDSIPPSWLRVKDAVAELARARSVLRTSELERLCEGDAATPTTERITNPDEQRAILTLLHDLGVVVAHGLRSDAPAVRREITILDPNWLTGAIYTLITSPTVRDLRGELRHDQLGQLLDAGRYPARWHELILSMMQEPELGLCLLIRYGGPPRYLLPDALPVDEPAYELSLVTLRFRFKYSRLPKDLIPRFIVEAHRSLTDDPVLWRTGVVLAAEGCRILVRGEIARDRVEIQVAGRTGQRAALSIVRNYFDAAHQHFARLFPSPRVPLPEQPEVDVGYDHLIQLEQRKGLAYEFLPEGAIRDYSVRELLEGVRDDESLRRHRHLAAMDGPEHEAGSAGWVGSRYRGRIDFGILTIREDENAAVLRRFPKVATEARQRRYRIRSLSLPGGGAYTLAVLRCLEQGNTDAQASAHALLDDLAPRFVLVVGIAGAVPSDELRLGDVVISSRIVDFSVESVTRGRGRGYALGGGPLHPEAARLAADTGAMLVDGELDGWNRPDALALHPPPIDLASDNFYGDEAWRRSVREKLERHTRALRPPLALAGSIASSDRLIKDDEILSVWLKIARQVVAVEMESAGIYKATQARNAPFLAIRGISDVVGYKRHPEWTAYACETAAAFTRAFLLTRPIEPIA